jgi:Zn-dependent peptidase ImmA (M78 family)/transcriptional regulator with XRE-family HTH domain
MSGRIDAIVNPEMLLWARQKSGFDLIGASRRIGVKSERLQAWENGELFPTINQALKMADVYQRPLSVFYLEEPPQDFSIAMTDFRRIPDSEISEFSPGLIRELRVAEMRRDIMLELSNENESGVFSHIDTVTITENPNRVAQNIRTSLDISWETQRRWFTSYEALNGWREAIEKQNVLVFHSRHVGLSFMPSEAHGISMSEPIFPVIVLNSKDTPHRRIFTLLHEYAHLLLHHGGICDTWEYANIQNNQQRTEVFCNQVAGAVLVPPSLLLASETIRNHRQQTEWLDEEISSLSKNFSTSKEVIVRRLLSLGLVSPQFYEMKREEYLEAWMEYKETRRSRGGGSAPYHRMVLRNNGNPYTTQVFYAYYDNQITLSDVSDYLGAKIKDIKRMEQVLFSASIGV